MNEIKIPPPDANALAWVMENWDSIVETMRFAQKFRALKIHTVAPVGPPAAGTSLVEAADNIVFPIPLQFSTTIMAPTGGATIDTECRATVTKILAAMSQTGQNPA